MSDKRTEEILEFLEKNRIEGSFKEKKIKLKKGKTVTFDLEDRELRIVKYIPWKVKIRHPFDTLKNFELKTIERYADATPFQDGYKEFVHSIKINTTEGKVVTLFHFVDRDPEGSDMLAVLVEMLSGVVGVSR